MLLSLVLFVVSVESAQAASLMFSDGFESYPNSSRLPLTTWNTEDARTAAFIVSAPTDGLFGVHGGSRMARTRWNGTVPLSDVVNSFETLAINPDTYANNEWFFRVYLRLDANFHIIQGGDSGSHLLRSLTNAGPLTMEFVENQSSNSTVTGVRVNNSDFLVNVFAGKLQPGQWYKYERYVNYTTGTIRTWWNGVLRAESTTLNFAGSKFGNVNLAGNWGDPSPGPTNDLYWDDFQLFTDRNTGGGVTGLMSDASIQATGGGGPPPDTSPPSAPTNLRITSSASKVINVAWDAATDDVAVQNYAVERCDGSGCSAYNQVVTTVSLSFGEFNLLTNFSYSYRVRARDTSNNFGAYSNIVTQVTDTVKFHPTLNMRRVSTDSLVSLFNTYFGGHDEAIYY